MVGPREVAFASVEGELFPDDVKTLELVHHRDGVTAVVGAEVDGATVGEEGGPVFRIPEGVAVPATGIHCDLFRVERPECCRRAGSGQ